MSNNRRMRGENRFYNPPAMRKLQQEREEKKRLESEDEKKKAKELLDRQIKAVEEKEEEKIKEPEECSTSDCSVPVRVGSTLSNLGRFLECTTPVVSTQYLPLTSIKGWRTREPEHCSYFLLNDLWDSFEEWSAYGVGVPLLLNGIDSVVQYYVPFLSGIQLYEDRSRACTSMRNSRAGEESDGDSSRDMSSDGSNDCRELSQSLYRASLEEKPFIGSSSDESEASSNSPGGLVFEYLEAENPYHREPLADKMSNLSSQFPALRTYRSCDLSPSSWVSVAWYPIYRIPVGQSFQNLEACFLTFHSLSTPSRGTSNEEGQSSSNEEGQSSSNEEGQSSSESVASSKLPLPTFGLVSYKFQQSVWSPESNVDENQRLGTLLRAAEEWLRRLKVILPDFIHFVTSYNGSRWR